MNGKRMIAAFAAVCCLAVGLGAWGVVSQLRIAQLNARIREYELDASADMQGEAPAIKLENPDAIAAEFNGGVITAAQAAQEYALISGYYQMLGVAEADYEEDAKYTVIDGLVEQEILAIKAREAGVYELNEAQVAEIEALVQAEYDDNVAYYMEFRFDPAKTEEQVREETIAYLNENGYSYEQMLADAKQNAWRDLLFEKVTAEMTIDDAQLREFYESQVTSSEMTYMADFAEYEMDCEAGRTIVWHPEGVRRVQVIQASFDEEQGIEYLSIQGALMNGDNSKLDALEALYQQVEGRAQEALDRVNAGEDFAALIGEYGGAEQVSVSARSALWGDAFRDAAMALEQPGDVSGLVRTDGGVCILRYAEDVPAGRVDYEQVKESLRVNYEAEIKSSYYNAAVLGWMEEADIQYHLDTF